MTALQVKWAKSHDWFRHAAKVGDTWIVWIDATEYHSDGSIVEKYERYSDVTTLRAAVGY